MKQKLTRPLSVLAVSSIVLGGMLLAPTIATAADDVTVLRINEIETDGSPDWIEIINTGTEEVNASGVTLTGRENAVSIVLPADTIIPAQGTYVAESSTFKLKKNDRAELRAPDGVTVIDAYEWGDYHLSTWGRIPNGTGDFVQLDTKTKGAENVAPEVVPPLDPDDTTWQSIKINEVTSANTDPYHDAYELVNLGEVDVNVANWRQADSGSLPSPLNAPNGTIVPAGGYLVLLSNQGLSSDGDSVRLYLSDGTTLVDSVTWLQNDAQPGSWSRCEDGTGNFVHTETESWGESNADACSGRIIDSYDPSGDVQCQTEPPSDLGAPLAGGVAWPGSQDWVVADEQCQFVNEISGQDVSGLDIDPSDPNVMWAVKNKSHVYRLIKSEGLWVLDTSNDWGEGKALVFPSGSGQPDTEGITVGADGYLYMTTERDNTNNRVALDSVLRYDPNQTGTVLVPTAEWDLTSEFAGIIDPAVGADANLGFEGITWVPDEFLTAGGFYDESTERAYDPENYPGHGGGLFFLALEKNGHIYAYALGDLGQVQRIADIDSGLPRIAETQWDADAQRLWAVADDSVGGSATLLRLNEEGSFTLDRIYDRPTGLANLNLEGFAIAPNSTCVDGFKEVVRSDDGNNGGHSLWSGTIACDLGLDDVQPPTQPSLTLSALSVVAGNTINIHAEGLEANTEYTVTLNSDPVILGVARTDANGVLVMNNVLIPASVPAGAHTITLATTALPGTVVVSAGITVTAATSGGTGSGSTGSLSNTGADSMLWLGLGAPLLLIAGIAVIGVARARRSQA